VGARLKVGVAGVGSLGFHHARILAAMDSVEHAGIFDARAERAAEVGAQLGVPGAATRDARLGRSDAIVSAVTTESHEEV
jgi:myo-inositol 2-dehydrogenase/D-chiro-inositol 1-dehydrogenase